MWNKIIFNSNNIEYSTDKSTLIKMSRKSEYPDYKFWFPSKLIRAVPGKDYLITLSYTDDFVFHLKKYGSGKHNKYDIVNSISLNAQDIEEAFYNEKYVYDCSDSNEESYLEVTKPQKIEVKGVVDECLKNN